MNVLMYSDLDAMDSADIPLLNTNTPLSETVIIDEPNHEEVLFIEASHQKIKGSGTCGCTKNKKYLILTGVFIGGLIIGKNI
ncbi:hypothetical protein JJL45_09160 [Tamlana sp. s12]|uniref:hypothetical protein n=1 Tax=Tamlana sp. s12 TaxID=1630406 RepID=UPI0007FB7FE3|nr:hypothetical protein [Tamlana sp. s12]OBQ52875.1 hypothetical protein VQ01_13080 [Tamlana sp. s12]QQY81098.1 hypothetical protein JJL45_09160 [Tamlana sp. s12]